jgi:Asp-tRNA(Asn)/Glu-tRNA(Gln) amidotransferase A subunit family amidase
MPSPMSAIPAMSLPVGRDRHGLPFGLKIVGPRGRTKALAVAAELESLSAGDH